MAFHLCEYGDAWSDEQPGKRLVTLWTLIWLFACVSTEVRGQTTRHVKRLVTLWALIYGFHLCEYGGARSDY